MVALSESKSHACQFSLSVKAPSIGHSPALNGLLRAQAYPCSSIVAPHVWPGGMALLVCGFGDRSTILIVTGPPSRMPDLWYVGH